MWAEWMKDYDLRLTKEEIEEYEKRKKGKSMNLLDKIMRVFGYENIENINICEEFKRHPPRKEKMYWRRIYYKHIKKLPVPIIIKKRWVWKGNLMNDYIPCLIDGYTSYLIAKENNIKYVKVVRV